MAKAWKLSPLTVVLYGCMLALLVLALVHYRLRIFSDTAGYITDMTINGGFYIGHHRFVSVCNQWLPALFIKAEASLRAIAIAYSLAYTLLPVVLALTCIHWLKRPFHALAILMQVTLMNMLLFYYAVSELQTGLLLLLFYDALSDHYREAGRQPAFLIGTLILVPAVAFSHPVNIAVFGFWVIYRLLKELPDYRRTAMAAGVFVMAYIVKRLWLTTSYEAGKLPGADSLQTFGLHYYNGPFARSFYSYVIAEAFLVPVVLMSAIGLLIYLRKYRLVALLVLSVGSIYTLVLIEFEDWFVHLYDHYYEHILQTALFFIVLLFSYGLARIRGRRFAVAAFIAVIFAISLAKIQRGSEFHAARQAWLYNCLGLMDELKVKKAVMARSRIPGDLAPASFWSSNWESLILSALDSPRRAKTLFLAWDIRQVREPVQAGDEFVTDGRSFKQRLLPERYFVLGDEPYVFLDGAVPDSVLDGLRAR